MSGVRNLNLAETTVRFSDSLHEPVIYEDQVKARLQTITSFVEDLNTSTVDLLLAEKPFAWRACPMKTCALDYGPISTRRLVTWT